jgi:N-acetylglucosaminyldiphosphoundecaprenol N-acetyl-beta-D-mannosaminyltransferase
MQNLPTEAILGFAVTTASRQECVERILSWIAVRQQPRYAVCANPHSLVTAGTLPNFAAALQQADMMVPDGSGIVLASRLLGGTIRQRITGYDLFHDVCTALNRQGAGKVFFLGSTEENLAVIERRFTADFPALTFAAFSPPFRTEFSDEDRASICQAVNAARPDVVWVGMTAPKQEIWICENRQQLDVPFLGAVGAVFDFYSGTVRRSPTLFQQLGLEWLPRLLREPRRLWRRNFVSSPLFLLQVVKARIRMGR